MTSAELEELREYAKHIEHNITPLDTKKLERMASMVLDLIHLHEGLSGQIQDLWATLPE
jgi:hypothetical protein